VIFLHPCSSHFCESPAPEICSHISISFTPLLSSYPYLSWILFSFYTFLRRRRSGVTDERPVFFHQITSSVQTSYRHSISILMQDSPKHSLILFLSPLIAEIFSSTLLPDSALNHAFVFSSRRRHLSSLLLYRINLNLSSLQEAFFVFHLSQRLRGHFRLPPPFCAVGTQSPLTSSTSVPQRTPSLLARSYLRSDLPPRRFRNLRSPTF